MLKESEIKILWQSFKGYIPEHKTSHPLKTHRKRRDNYLSFKALVLKCKEGYSYERAACDVGIGVSTLKRRREEWHYIWPLFYAEALKAYDKIIGLDLSHCSVDTTTMRTPRGSDMTSKDFKLQKPGTKFSLLVDKNGIPLHIVQALPSTPDHYLLKRTIGLYKDEIKTLHVDRGYWAQWIKDMVKAMGIELVIPHKRQKKKQHLKQESVKTHDRHRYKIERTNAWLKNYHQIEKMTDRNSDFHYNWVLLASTIIVTKKLIKNKARYVVPGFV